MPFSFMHITNDPEIASICEHVGIDRVFIDMEWKGKQQRQGHIDSVKSFHTINDIRNVKKRLSKSKVLVRINPFDLQSKEEIEQSLDAGAEYIMLPMARTAEEVKNFTDAVAQRVPTILLLETQDAANNLEKILSSCPIDEVHIGLNDLSIEYKEPFMFTLLANGTVENLCKRIKKFNIPYGFGGIARIGCGQLPAEKILAEHVRLHSTRTILSRSFFTPQPNQSYQEIALFFQQEFTKIQDTLSQIVNHMSPQALLNNKQSIQDVVSKY